MADNVLCDVPDNRFYPKNVPQLALHKSGEFRVYSDVPAEGPFPEPLAIRCGPIGRA